MSVWQASRAVVENTEMAFVQPSRFTLLKVQPETVGITGEGVEFDTTTWRGKPADHFAFAFVAAHSSRIACNKNGAANLVRKRNPVMTI